MAMHEFPPLLPDEVIERAKKLNPALLADGMKGLGILKDGVMEAAIMPVNPDPSMMMVGTAVTVETANGDNFPIHVASYSLPAEGYVMVIDGKNYPDRAYFGDLIMGACKAVGYAGMVIDGYTRDRQGCIEMNFPVYSKGQMQAGPLKKDAGNINAPILCGGVQVNPGDLVVGGADGVTVVPRDRIEEVLEKAEEKARYEDKRDAAIAAYNQAKAEGKPLPNLAPQWVLDLLEAQK